MPIDLKELEESLIKFRLDVIERLTEISAEISALQTAVSEAPVSKTRLQALRRASKKILYQFRDSHLQRISLPHQLR